jgi:hypothetical protein
LTAIVAAMGMGMGMGRSSLNSLNNHYHRFLESGGWENMQDGLMFEARIVLNPL